MLTLMYGIVAVVSVHELLLPEPNACHGLHRLLSPGNGSKWIMNQIQNGGRHGGTILVWWLESSLYWHIMFGGFGSYVFFSFQSRFKLFLKVFILLFRFMLNLLGALLKWIVPTTLGNLQLVSLLLELFSTFRHSKYPFLPMGKISLG